MQIAFPVPPLAFPNPPIAEGRIVLRRMEASDIGWITAACGDREVSRYVPGIPYPYTEADARAFAEHAARRDSVMFSLLPS